MLKDWENYFKELLDQEGNNNDLELPWKVEVTDITDTRKTDEEGIDEMRVEMVMAAGESGISWTKRLPNTCMRQVKVPEKWRTMLTVPMERRCARPWEIQRHHTSKSHHEAESEVPG